MMKKIPVGIWWIGAAIVVILGVIIFSHSSPTTSSVSTTSTSTDTQTSVTSESGLPGIQITPAPWTVELSHLRERLTAIGLPALSAEGTVLHIHQHLDIFIGGKPIEVPAGIGINQLAGFISPIHVHDYTGIIHVESPTVQTFTLGQFFDIWGVKFTNDCIGSYCASSTDSLKVYVNGVLYKGDPREIELTAHEEIAVVYGTTKEIPTTIPSTYTFPLGE